jgi:hypothetical protein
MVPVLGLQLQQEVDDGLDVLAEGHIILIRNEATEDDLYYIVYEITK